jgi:hypothetical protein
LIGRSLGDIGTPIIIYLEKEENIVIFVKGYQKTVNGARGQKV